MSLRHVQAGRGFLWQFNRDHIHFGHAKQLPAFFVGTISTELAASSPSDRLRFVSPEPLDRQF
jgi:hypothetical protein